MAKHSSQAYDAAPDVVFDALRRVVVARDYVVQGEDRARAILWFAKRRKRFSGSVVVETDGSTRLVLAPTAGSAGELLVEVQRELAHPTLEQPAMQPESVAKPVPEVRDEPDNPVSAGPHFSPSLSEKQQQRCMELLDRHLPPEEVLLAVYPSSSVSYSFLVITRERVFGLAPTHKNNPARLFTRAVQAHEINRVHGERKRIASELYVQPHRGPRLEWGNLPRDEIDEIVERVERLVTPEVQAKARELEATRQAMLIEDERVLRQSRQALVDALEQVIALRRDGLTDDIPLCDATFLKRAIAAQRTGDVRAEEQAIQSGMRASHSRSKFKQHVEQLRRKGALRRGQHLGTVTQHYSGLGDVFKGQIWVSSSSHGARSLEIWRDRIVTNNGRVFVVDHELRASVDAAGDITVTHRASPLGMLLGAPLPGSAVVPGLFFSRKETHDNRELYFVLEHPTWAIAAKVDPKQGKRMRELATGLN